MSTTLGQLWKKRVGGFRASGIPLGRRSVIDELYTEYCTFFEGGRSNHGVVKLPIQGSVAS